jgi:TolA-binding protein
MAPCIDPRFEAAVLDGAHGGAMFTDAEAAHLEACERCRAAVERCRRMAEIWTSLEPSPGEVQRARARFFAARAVRASRRKPRIAPVSFALAAILVAAMASAAVRAGMKYVHGTAPRDAGEGARHGLVPPAPPEAPAAPAAAIEPAPSAGIEPAPSAGIAPRYAAGVAATTPHASIGVRGRSAEVRAPRPTPAIEAPRSDGADPKAAPNAAERAHAWAAAAEAMRAADYGRAETAFAELTGSADPHTRDAARLARAQVWVAQGRLVEARPELEDLAAHGATPALRSRAAAAIERLR